jgi:hypothetical protein
MRLTPAIVVVLALAPGCTHKALRKHTVLTAGTVTEMQYEMVLSNVAMLACHPGLLPWHVRLNDGAIQVNDEGRFNAESLLYRESPPILGFDRLGPRVARNVTEQWDVGPVTDPRRLKALQAAYRRLFALGPLGALPQIEGEMREDEPDNDVTGPDLIAWTLPQSRSVRFPENENEDDKEREEPKDREEVDLEVEEVDPEVEIERLIAQVPTGWFHLGHK